MATPTEEAETPEQQRAAKRKTHRKSRNGCFQCKQRHTKADTHISSALETYRKILEHPAEETAMAMFLLSVVIVTYNLASAQLEAPEDPIGALHHCFRLAQGVSVVIQPHVTQIMNSKMLSKIVEQGPGLTFNGEVPEVLRLKKLAETKKTSAHDFYTLAIDDLHTHFLKTRQCPPENDRLVCKRS
ncbi:uncharacterized protein N0V89_005955 [Didymosphaeria variabile]|uniref:Uncharacterized protein n=1 Tax=Didymosphaeria variabile TaxID=1932322 RepID=A0A9W8XMB6_9PLEO|nr:uncharacterized protein N0V89_005955 [Didymosphaeria variabile]KAJ4354221.1 hypothetical protein N0V89_005955 [Didymosphaeria variabile]